MDNDPQNPESQIADFRDFSEVQESSQNEAVETTQEAPQEEIIKKEIKHPVVISIITSILLMVLLGIVITLINKASQTPKAPPLETPPLPAGKFIPKK